MFRRIRDFTRRHRGKLVFATVAGGAAYFAGRYVHRRFLEWQQSATNDLLEQTKKHIHFESTQRTCVDTTAALCATLVAKAKERFNPDSIIAAIKAAGAASAAEKMPLWEKLKACSLCRAFASIYGGAMLCVLTSVQLNVVGGYLFVQMNQNEENLNGFGSMEQEAYLSSMTEFVSRGFAQFCDDMEIIVNELVAATPLKKQLNFANVNSLTFSVKNELDALLQGKLLEYIYPLLENEESILTTVVQETRDVFENPDVFSVIRHLTQVGTNELLDGIAREWIVKSKEAKPPSDEADDIEETNANVIPQLSMFHDFSMPFAKLLPLYAGFSPFTLLNDMMKAEQLKSFSANVYETFSVAATRI